MEFLSEDTIKRATLSFMKTYYKFRPRRGETVVSYDKMHPSGVIVDGYLEFPKEDGSLFVATFESTSAATSPEVRYSLQRRQLLWDALAISSALTCFLMLILWVYEVWSIEKAGGLFSIVLVCTLMGLSVLAYHMFFRSAGRYRYIYAIEQFKQYHADEQWIAIGHDVFSSGNDLHFIELKSQCVDNGFGLVMIDKDEHVNLLITPAREEVFGKRRRSLKFMENPSIQSLRSFSPTSLERYRRPYMAQALTCLFSVAVLSGIFYRQWQMRPVEVVSSPSSYQDSLARLVQRLEPEPNQYLYKEDEAAIHKNPSTVNTSPTAPNSPEKNEIGLYVYTPTDGYLIYDCARAGVRGTKYVVQDILYNTFDEARKRIDQLKTYGLIANCISLNCTESSTSGYCVYYDLLFNTEQAANDKAVQIKKELGQLHLPHEFIKIRVLKF